VRDHPEFGFVPKDREMREIPPPTELVKRLKARERTSNLSLPRNGKPNGHILRTLKSLAKHACVDPKICGLHVFRKTFATRLHREPLGQVSRGSPWEYNTAWDGPLGLFHIGCATREFEPPSDSRGTLAHASQAPMSFTPRMEHRWIDSTSIVANAHA